MVECRCKGPRVGRRHAIDKENWRAPKRKMPSEVTATMETETGQPPPPVRW